MFQYEALLLRLYAAQGCRVSLAEGVVVPLMQCPLLVRAAIWNLDQGAGDSYATLLEGHGVIFNVHQRMLAAGTVVQRPSEGLHTH